MNQTAADRRRHRRFDITLPVREIRPQSHVFRATSVSAGGAYCPEALPRDVGTVLLVEVDMLGVGEAVVIPAKVVHAGRAGGLGLGLEFARPQSGIGEALAAL